MIDLAVTGGNRILQYLHVILVNVITVAFLNGKDHFLSSRLSSISIFLNT